MISNITDVSVGSWLIKLSDKQYYELYGDREVDEPGDFIAERYFVRACSAEGRSWERPCGIGAKGKAAAERLCAKVRERLAAGGALNPVYWEEGPMVYGSEAYQKYGGEAELLQFEKECEAFDK